MTLAQNMTGLFIFFAAGGALRLYLAKKNEPPSPIGSRFDVEALAALAHRLVLGGAGVREAASDVAKTVADPDTGTISREDHLRLAVLVSERVHERLRA